MRLLKKILFATVLLSVSIRVCVGEMPAHDPINSTARQRESRLSLLQMLDHEMTSDVTDTLSRPSNALIFGQEYEVDVFRMTNGVKVAVDRTGRIRELFVPPEVAPQHPLDHRELSKRLLKTILSDGIVVSDAVLREDPGKTVEYWYQRVMGGIPVESQGVRMVFDLQKHNLIFLQNSTEEMNESPADLKPSIDRKRSLMIAKSVVQDDLKSSRWRGVVNPEDEVVIDESGAGILIIVHPNSRFTSEQDRVPQRVGKGRWILAYDVLVDVTSKSSPAAEKRRGARMGARVWIDAHTGEVVGGQ